jgi:hypothetical protein
VADDANELIAAVVKPKELNGTKVTPINFLSEQEQHGGEDQSKTLKR